ncbi:hypothetical protein [Pseudorhodoferax sp.]|uniref:thiolase family protein n=1 Tax=Pseudorhodoferax sp. TaxID=1993553 RepID=UPI0039E5CA7D
MREAFIASTARTPIGRAFEGAFNNVESPSPMGHAVQRAGVAPGEIEDAVIGRVLAAGTSGSDTGRLAVLAAGLPVEVSAQPLDRQCSPGWMAIATAAKQVIVDGMDVTVGGGMGAAGLSEVA